MQIPGGIVNKEIISIKIVLAPNFHGLKSLHEMYGLYIDEEISVQFTKGKFHKHYYFFKAKLCTCVHCYTNLHLEPLKDYDN